MIQTLDAYAQFNNNDSRCKHSAGYTPRPPRKAASICCTSVRMSEPGAHDTHSSCFALASTGLHALNCWELNSSWASLRYSGPSSTASSPNWADKASMDFDTCSAASAKAPSWVRGSATMVATRPHTTASTYHAQSAGSQVLRCTQQRGRFVEVLPPERDTSFQQECGLHERQRVNNTIHTATSTLHTAWRLCHLLFVVTGWGSR